MAWPVATRRVRLLCYVRAIDSMAVEQAIQEREAVAGPEPQPPKASSRGLIGPIRIVAAVACLAVSALAAAIAYGVGNQLHAVYQASGTIRIAIPSQNGISDPNVTAANDLATQYAQLVSSDQVKTQTAQALSVAPNTLNGKLSGGTIAAQNLIQVTASGDSAAQAHDRATAAVVVVQNFLASVTAQQNGQYLATVRKALGKPPRVSAPPNSPPGAAAQAALSQATARQQVIDQTARDAAGNQPDFQVVDAAGSATQTSPKPKLYALVAFVVALLIAGRLAFVLSRPARA
jgi:capsular polysaccharide biosynthesis protein